MSTKYIFITGGVVSGLGKGITAASLGRLLKNRGYKVTIQKFDPYINVDPGIMSPLEHGEVFVTDDGAETDLDLGHYERFTDESLTKACSVTAGRIYLNVIDKERRGEYLGKTVQVIPHITNEIKNNIYHFEDENIDIVITEIGGTVGDMESLPHIEAIRQIGIEKSPEDVLYIHVTLLPIVAGTDELKSKPTQHSVKELQSLGISPKILVCRAEREIDARLKEKISLFCNTRKEDIIANLTVDNLYAVPLALEEEGLADSVCRHLKLENAKNNAEWEKMIENVRKINENVRIAIVGKYVKLCDSYLSAMESLRHGGFHNNVNVDVTYIDSESVTKENAKDILKDYDGILVPAGFGVRGVEGKIQAVKYARESNIPFLGIGLGMQAAVIEFARNVLGLEDADSTEFNESTQNPVIYMMNNQESVSHYGGKMRLGAYPCRIKEGTKAREIYGQEDISERHRNRYEYNQKYKEQLEGQGLICSGISPDGKLVEIVEYTSHPFFVGVGFHPEFKSRPDKPAPLFSAFIKAVKKRG